MPNNSDNGEDDDNDDNDDDDGGGENEFVESKNNIHELLVLKERNKNRRTIFVSYAV